MRTFFHGHSFTGNQLGCAAALANLKLHEKEKILEQVQEKITFVAQEIQGIK